MYGHFCLVPRVSVHDRYYCTTFNEQRIKWMRPNEQRLIRTAAKRNVVYQNAAKRNDTNKSTMLHPSRSYKRSLGRFGMTGGLVATQDGPTTSTNKLQTRQTLSTNYTEHMRLPYFASDYIMHRWPHTYIVSRRNTQQSVSTARTVMRPLNILYSTAHCTTTSGAKTIKKNTNSTQNKSQTHRAKQYKVTSFLSTDCELSTDTCSKNVYSLGPRLLPAQPNIHIRINYTTATNSHLQYVSHEQT